MYLVCMYLVPSHTIFCHATSLPNQKNLPFFYFFPFFLIMQPISKKKDLNILFCLLTQCFYPLTSKELVSPVCRIFLNACSSIIRVLAIYSPEINKNTDAAHENISCAFVKKNIKIKHSTS